MSMSWLDDVRYACKELKADCAIYSGHHSCKQTWSVTSILSKELMKRDGIPWLSLQGDSWIRRTTPISVIQHDIDEFISNVVTSRPTGRRKLGRKEAREVTS
jgi:hypothetical protein